MEARALSFVSPEGGPVGDSAVSRGVGEEEVVGVTLDSPGVVVLYTLVACRLELLDGQWEIRLILKMLAGKTRLVPQNLLRFG